MQRKESDLLMPCAQGACNLLTAPSHTDMRNMQCHSLLNYCPICLQSIQAKQRAAQEAGEHAAAARMSSKRLALEIQKRGWRVGAPQLLVGR